MGEDGGVDLEDVSTRPADVGGADVGGTDAGGTDIGGADASGVDARAVLVALAESNRSAVVRLLEERHRSQKGLCRDLGISQPLLSHHLKVLAGVGLVESSVCEGVKVYQLRTDTLAALAGRLAEMTRHSAEVARHRPC